MTDLEIFFRNAKKLDIHPKRIGFDANLAEDFVTKYGEERALGYIQALNDVFQGLERVLYIYKCVGQKGIEHQPFKARSNLEKFMNHNEEILKVCNQIVSYDAPPKQQIG